MINIRKHLEKDIPYRVKWLSDPVVNKYIGDSMGKKTNLNKQKEWFLKYKKSKDKKFFTICDKSEPIGFMGLSNINRENKNANIFIAIGEKDYHGKGIGEFSMKWLVDHAFKKAKLHKINLGVIEDNLPAVNLYKKIGFVIEGKMKNEFFNKGKFYNLILMAIFNKDK